MSHYPPNFDWTDLDKIRDNIEFIRKPMGWEEVENSAIDLDDIGEDILKSILKLPVYNVTDLNEFFDNNNGKDIQEITSNNWIFYMDIKIPYQVFIIRLQIGNVDVALMVDTQGYNYMRYVSLIKEFGEMYDYYKKDFELRNSRHSYLNENLEWPIGKWINKVDVPSPNTEYYIVVEDHDGISVYSAGSYGWESNINTETGRSSYLQHGKNTTGHFMIIPALS
jgi:hypothetical protein